MNGTDLKQRLVSYTVEHSGHEPHRDYLGMSQIYRDEDDLVREMLTGQQWHPTDDDHLMLYMGRLFEGDLLDRLDGAGLLVQGSEEREIVAAFDERFAGHIDGEVLSDRTVCLVEVKCVTERTLRECRSRRRARDKDFQQAQMYLCHGGYDKGFIVYMSRETGQLYVHEVYPSRGLQDALNGKAKRVLAAVDAERKAAA